MALPIGLDNIVLVLVARNHDSLGALSRQVLFIGGVYVFETGLSKQRPEYIVFQMLKI